MSADVEPRLPEVDRARGVVAGLIDEWTDARARLTALEAAERPDLVDHFGRAWQWRGRGDLYVHDDTLAFPKDWVLGSEMGLPHPRLANNPNYARLCDTCRQGWPGSLPAQRAEGHEAAERVGGAA
ncbi:hypothetical protein [Parafrankia sp. FMc2]|uniref:hypothetical protein n=1 Tax=Parafrankia sp. FMc2 TaxID=3233196 RepID=UPI0034D6F9C7